MFIAALVTAQSWKKPKSPSTGERIKYGSTEKEQTAVTHATTRMSLRNTISTEETRE